LRACVALISGGLIDLILWAHHRGLMGFSTYIALIALISPLLIVGRDLEDAVELSFLSVTSSILIVLPSLLSSLFSGVPFAEELGRMFASLIVMSIVHLTVLLLGITSLAFAREFLWDWLRETLSSRRGRGAT